MNSGVVSASSSSLNLNLKPRIRQPQSFQSPSFVVVPYHVTQFNGDSTRFQQGLRFCCKKKSYNNNNNNNQTVCASSIGPGGPNSGESDNKRVLDAFFLGKALAETLNERIESAVGEFLSTVGRLQAEQQKQIQDLQEEVLERAKRAKEKAAREAREAQGLAPKSTTTIVVPSIDIENSPSSSSPAARSVETDSDPSIGVVTLPKDE